MLVRLPRVPFATSKDDAAMPLGIRALNDFAFKKVFGSAENREALVSLLNAVLRPKAPIRDVTLQNPFNPQDFQDDKLSILDIKAKDSAGAIYDVEIQLSVSANLTQRIAYYGCELYAGQLEHGADYAVLRPVYAIWLINGVLWRDGAQVQHAFRLTDAASGRTLKETLEIHTVELAKYK
jgi:predicted transposase/invertase (TIGR01784 family)